MDYRKDGTRTKSEDLIAKVRKCIAAAWEHDKDNRLDAAKDLRMIAGDQWDDQARQERQRDGRPTLTINRLPQFIRQITNDIRQADLAIKVLPVDENGDENLAKTYNGLLRQIHYRSNGQHVYAMAAEHQVGCGIGWIRVVSEYIDDAAFDQELLVKGIRNPLSVYCDPAAIEPDRSDAQWIAVVEMLPRAEFERRYPDATASDVDKPDDYQNSMLFWSSPDMVRIAEYWWKEPKTLTLALMPDMTTLDITGWTREQLSYIPAPIKTRQAQGWQIKMAIVSGSAVLEEPVDWVGKHIPLVPVIGAEVPLESTTYRYGAIRFARDPQQLYNYARSAAAESIAAQPKAPYLVTTKMIAQHKALWDSASNKNRPYLPYDPDPAAPQAAPRREAPPPMPAAFLQEAEIAAEDMKGTTGIYDAGLGAQSNETSGRAILARDRQGDVSNYHFSDNLKRALEHIGRILIDLIPKIYDNERVVRILGDDDAEEFVEINKVLYLNNGMPVKINDLSTARFDVRVTVGPSYSTKRVEAADSIMAFIQAVPDAAPLIGDLLAKTQDWPEAEEIAKRLRNMVPPQALQEPEEEQGPNGEPPPPTEEEMLAEDMARRAAMAELIQMEADAENKKAEARKKHAEALRLELETQSMFGAPPDSQQYVDLQPANEPSAPAAPPPQAMPPGPAEPWSPPMDMDINPSAMPGQQPMMPQDMTMQPAFQ